MLRYLFWKGAGVIKGTNLLVTHARLLLCDSADSHEMSWIKAASDSVTWELSIREALSWQIGLLLYLEGPYLWFRRPFICCAHLRFFQFLFKGLLLIDDCLPGQKNTRQSEVLLFLCQSQTNRIRKRGMKTAKMHQLKWSLKVIRLKS